MPIEAPFLSGSIESAQMKVEDRNFGIRKNVLQFDDVMNSQREVIYSQRSKVLDGEDISGIIKTMIHETISETVDRYLADERCTFSFTLNGYYSLFTGIARLHDRRLLARIPKGMPVLLLSGGDDPVGEKGRAVLRAAASLRRAGLSRVSVKLYPGARHELLVELNRQEVFADIAGWIEALL